MLNRSRALTRGRLVLLAATVVVVLGVLAGIGALWLRPARAAVGPLPAEALVLPADARFVMGLDVQRFTASPFYARYAVRQGMQPQALIELQQKTGLDPARDLAQVVVAGGAARGTDTLAVVIGRFDRARIGRALQGAGKARVSNHEGATVYAMSTPGASDAGLAFLADDAIALGPKGRVEAAVASRARGEAPLRSNAALVTLIEKIRPGSTFWLVGDRTLLSALPTAAGGGGGAMLDLPALRSLTVTGDLDPVLSVNITGEAADEAAAKGLADVVRGLLALLTIQAQQKPELQQFASAVSVANEANRVLVAARVPYPLLDALQAGVRPAAPPAPARRPLPAERAPSRGPQQ